MSSTLVLQSHRSPLPFTWLADCLESVKSWAASNKYDYLFLGDELFDPVPQNLLDKTRTQTVIATDLARLLQPQKYLAEGYETVVWCDADFLIFNPEKFKLLDEPYSLGREVWIQHDKNNRLKSYRKVHNAFLMFRRGNSFLDFYTDTAMRLLELNSGTMPPQFIGPKLLTALHNIAQCPVQESAGMFSPLVLKDIARGQGKALKMMIENSTDTLYAANISASMYAQTDSLNNFIPKALQQLLTHKHIVF